jgi:cytochrome c-type biogenesis protein CcmH
MTLFWLTAAAAAAAVAAWLLRPFFGRARRARLSRSAVNVAVYRDQLRELDADRAAGTLAQEDYARARAELEARLLRDVGESEAAPARAPGAAAAAVVAAAVPLLAFTVYLLVGNPGAVELEAAAHPSAAQVESMVERLAARLRENPEDVEGWRLLGRSNAVLGRYAQAADAYAKAAARAPRDAQLLADLADVLAMAQGQTLQGEPEKLVRRALELEPNNLKALALAGTAAYERKDFAAAAGFWERMLPHVAPGSEDARSIQQNVAEARALVGEKTENPAGAAASVRGTVSLAESLKDRAAPDDTVFVLARAADGPPMPLAVARVRVRDLPYRFRLDDSMAMTPAMKLSSFPKVIVAARVSKSGSATAQPGDLQGASAPVANDAAAVAVVIDSLVR